MTLGEHIQTLRREAGLSQEALGEALGVSRQAVSKWESDSAVPELDTLIAMSRLFRVTLGQLLQVEETARTEDGEVPRAEPDLAQVEAIVHRYIQEMEARRPRRKRWPYVAAAAVVIVAGMWAMERMDTMSSDLNRLKNQLYSVESSLGDRVDGLTGSLTQILEEQNSLVADSSREVIGLDMHRGVVTSRFSATLKSWQEGVQARFVISGTNAHGGEIQVLSERLDGPDYQAELEVPFGSDMGISLLVYQPDGVTQTQKLADHNLWEFREDHYALELNVTNSGGSVRMRQTEGRVEYDWPVVWDIFYPAAKVSDFELEPVRPVEQGLVLYRNDTLIREIPLTPEERDPTWTREVGISGTYDFKDTVEIREDCILTLAFCCTDNYGRTQYRELDRVKYIRDANGNWDLDPMIWEDRAEFPWATKHGEPQFVNGETGVPFPVIKLDES